MITHGVMISMRMIISKYDSQVRSWGGGSRVVVSIAAFHARVRGSLLGLGGVKETKCFFPIHS